MDRLQGLGLNADGIHGDKPQATRQRALDRFKSNEVKILVATDVAARGLDIDDLPTVVNLDLPIVAEDYIHRIGRTGRAGLTGEAISLVCADEVELLSAIEVLTRQTLERKEEQDFEPEHRVPTTDASGQILKNPRNRKSPRSRAANVTWANGSTAASQSLRQRSNPYVKCRSSIPARARRSLDIRMWARAGRRSHRRIYV